MVTGGNKSSEPVTCEVNQKSKNSKTIVSCGYTWLEQKIIIVNPESLIPCAEEQVGEIWVRGESIGQGYWNKPEATAKIFQASLSGESKPKFLRTGDLGFIKDGELFVTGRLKDIIIIKGRNYYPEDIEFIVQQTHPSCRTNGTAAFTVENDREQQLIIVQEIERSYIKKLNTDNLIGDIRQAVMANYELQAQKIMLVKPSNIPKTSSGKIRRYACREKFITGKFNSIS